MLELKIRLDPASALVADKPRRASGLAMSHWLISPQTPEETVQIHGFAIYDVRFGRFGKLFPNDLLPGLLAGNWRALGSLHHDEFSSRHPLR